MDHNVVKVVPELAVAVDDLLHVVFDHLDAHLLQFCFNELVDRLLELLLGLLELLDCFLALLPLDIIVVYLLVVIADHSIVLVRVDEERNLALVLLLFHGHIKIGLVVVDFILDMVFQLVVLLFYFFFLNEVLSIEFKLIL